MSKSAHLNLHTSYLGMVPSALTADTSKYQCMLEEIIEKVQGGCNHHYGLSTFAVGGWTNSIFNTSSANRLFDVHFRKKKKRLSF